MIKYRTLSKEELFALEDEFKQFLIVNGLHDQEWRALCTEEPNKAQQFIDLFSNLVLEKVYSQVSGLVQIGQDFVSVFLLLEEPWRVYFFRSKDQNLIENINPSNFVEALVRLAPNLQVQIGTKKNTLPKAQAVHELISNGAQIAKQQSIQEFMQHFK